LIDEECVFMVDEQNPLKPVARQLSRREVLKAGALIGAYGVIRSLWPAWMPRMAFASDGVQGDTIVCIFLRGGADSLNMIVPFGDDNYYEARPVLAFGQPDSSDSQRVLELNDFFGLNPDMRPLHELFRAGHLAAVHATGMPHASRSHFEAMDLLERGTDGQGGASSGWLGRYLTATATEQDSPLRAIGWGEQLPRSLHGYVSSTAMRSIADFHLRGNSSQVDEMTDELAALYQASGVPAARAAQSTVEALEKVRQIDVDRYRPANGASYSDTDLGRALKQTAALIKADVGLEVACVDHGNYDTHVAQGRTDGLMSGLVQNLASSLRAFHDDLRDYMDRVTVVVMSEFGRRVQENGGGGTDHGHGGAMLVMNGQVTSRPVIAQWPGLQPDFLDNGDLQVTTDYRNVLSEIMLNRTPNVDITSVFPGHTYAPVGLFSTSG
jgi:uncharacterized protein (DUF1501 family)